MMTVTHVSVPVMVDRNSVMAMLNVHIDNMMILMVLYLAVRNLFNDDIMLEVMKRCVPSVLFADDMGASFTVEIVMLGHRG